MSGNDDFRAGLVRITKAIRHGKASWWLGPSETTAGASLAIGTPKAVAVDHGHVIVIGMTREELLRLREACNTLLGTIPS